MNATSSKLAASSNVLQNPSSRLDEVLVLLGKAKVEEHESAELKCIPDFRVNPNFATVLALERWLEEIVTFCTNPKELGISCIDQLSTYLMRTLVTMLPSTEIYN